MSSHRAAANTSGRAVLAGHTFAMYVSHFGASAQSTVVFLLNDEPVATRYLFSSASEPLFFPTISYENGRTVSVCELEVHIQPATRSSLLFHHLPLSSQQKQDDSSVKWIRPPGDQATCAVVTGGECLNEFENVAGGEDVPLQSPVPLGRQFTHYKCTQVELSGEGGVGSTNVNKREGASVGLASCSPLKPTPTSSLLRDYYTWLPHMKCTQPLSFLYLIFYFKGLYRLRL
jgi:hypothetical protein